MNELKSLYKKELEKEFANNFASPVFPILSELYLQDKDYSRAEKVCKIGLENDSNNLIGKYILSKIYLINNDVLKAEKLLKEVVNLDQNNINALLTLIEVQKKLKRSSNSIKKLINKAYCILPNNKEINRLYISKKK